MRTFRNVYIAVVFLSVLGFLIVTDSGEARKASTSRSSAEITQIEPGDIIITEIMPNPDAVWDQNGEWFEVYNNTDSPIEMEGFILHDNSGTYTIVGSNIVASLDYFVFCVNEILATNGGVPTDYEYPYASPNGLQLSNAGDVVKICTPSDVIIDSVQYASSWPYGAGYSMQLEDLAYNNDDVASWCASQNAWTGSLGDLGTPGISSDCSGGAVPTELTICQARQQNTCGVPTYLDSLIRIRGIVSFTDTCMVNAFLQDNDCGIALFGYSVGDTLLQPDRQMRPGDSIQVTGYLQFYAGQTEITYAFGFEPEVTLLDSDKIVVVTELPCHLISDAADIGDDSCSGESFECLSIHTEIINMELTGTFQGNTTYKAICASGDTIQIRIDDCSSFIGQPIPEGLQTVVGILGQYDWSPCQCQGYQIYPTEFYEVMDSCFSVSSDEFETEKTLVGGLSSTVQVQVTNQLGDSIHIAADTDVPYFVVDPPLLDLASFESGDFTVTFTPLIGVDSWGALHLTSPGCIEKLIYILGNGVPEPNTPGAVHIYRGPEVNQARFDIDVAMNIPSVEYAIQASIDNWATTSYAQGDGTLGLSPVWMTESDWGAYAAGVVDNVPSGSTLRMKALARQLIFTTPAGLEGTFVVPEPPDLPLIDDLTIMNVGDNLQFNWTQDSVDLGGYPLVDAEYIVSMATTPFGVYTVVDTFLVPPVTLPLGANSKEFYRIQMITPWTGLRPIPQITHPSRGSIISGFWPVMGLDDGLGSYVSGYTGQLQVKPFGVWEDLPDDTMPDWSIDEAFWIGLLRPDDYPTGICSIRVVESGPMGDFVGTNYFHVNRLPVIELTCSYDPIQQIMTFDASASYDPDGSIIGFHWWHSGGYHWGSILDLPMAPTDTVPITLTVWDELYQEQKVGGKGTASGCDTDSCKCKSVHLRYGQDDENDTIENPKKYWNKKNREDIGGRKDSLGSNVQDNADGKSMRVRHNFEVVAEVEGNPSLCKHHQTVDVVVIASVSDTIHQSKGPDNYNRQKENSARIQHTPKQGKQPAKIDWIDMPGAGKFNKKKLAERDSVRYTAHFCDVIIGTDNKCCRMKFTVTWTMRANGANTNPAINGITKDDECTCPNE
ncbi:lamin tail domain-containing protein [bacterium]|nr:lamin tail domain-containing protein [bacterium]MBU1935948.1 lamin tail domain-containing protein [bacterium]